MFAKELSKLTDSALSGNLGIEPNTALRSELSICIFLRSEELATSVLKLLDRDRYILMRSNSPEGFLDFIQRNSHLDCLVFEVYPELHLLVSQLQEHSIFLPVVILEAEANSEEAKLLSENQAMAPEGSHEENLHFFYHAAEVKLPIAKLSDLSSFIDQAMTQFLNLSVPVRARGHASTTDPTAELTSQSLLHRQQRRLAEKLRERLGYLGVYYKRNSQFFFRNLPSAERQKLLEQLQSNYREIVLNYFSPDSTLNNKIDEFVNVAFFADISVTQIVEIHMELMDEFANQLKLEGRSEEVLLDYRLTLIDAIAHLCEMYRRSIPRDS